PQVLDDPQDLGNHRANRQVATPVTPLPAGKGRWRVRRHEVPNRLLRQGRCTPRHLDHLQRRSTRLESFTGPQAFGAPGAQLGGGKAFGGAAGRRVLLSGPISAYFFSPHIGILLPRSTPAPRRWP